MYVDKYDGMISSSLWNGIFTLQSFNKVAVLFLNILIAAAGILTQIFFLTIQEICAGLCP